MYWFLYTIVFFWKKKNKTHKTFHILKMKHISKRKKKRFENEIILMFGCKDIRLKYINTDLTSINWLIVFISNIYISFLFIIDFICYRWWSPFKRQIKEGKHLSRYLGNYVNVHFAKYCFISAGFGQFEINTKVAEFL